MPITKNMKAGYQGKHDAMRAKAEKLLDHPGHAKDVYYSSSCADKSKMRTYKEGGTVKKEEKKKECLQKFAAGGVGKIRHGEATAAGMLKKMKKTSLKDFL
jgi:hypothetical protein